MTSIDVREIVSGSFFEDNGQLLHCVGVNPRYGSGYLSEIISLQHGIFILFQNFFLYGDGEIRIFREEGGLPFIAFVTYLSGIEPTPMPFMAGGIAGIESAGYGLPDFVKVKSNTPVQTLSVCIEPAAFERLTGKSSIELIESLEILEHNADRKIKPFGSENMYIAQKLCARQTVDSFRNDPGDTLFLKAKALELIALQLKQLNFLTGRSHGKPAIDYHVEKVSYACTILRKEMESPPSALELAGRVGLNHNQLARLFKEAIGMRPFEYLKTIRLEKAYNMIANHECNITEAALRIGYASPSHFTRSFKKKFGINPKQLHKENRTI